MLFAYEASTVKISSHSVVTTCAMLASHTTTVNRFVCDTNVEGFMVAGLSLRSGVTVSTYASFGCCWRERIRLSTAVAVSSRCRSWNSLTQLVTVLTISRADLRAAFDLVGLRLTRSARLTIFTFFSDIH